MAFDTKSPVPKVLFSPAGVTPEDDLATVANQAKSAAAEAAIKMNVYQADTSEEGDGGFETVAAIVSNVAAEADVAEPVKRESTKPSAEQPSDVSDIVKKWSKKG